MLEIPLTEKKPLFFSVFSYYCICTGFKTRCVNTGLKAVCDRELEHSVQKEKCPFQNY